jgi:hypothetical protein
MWWKHPFVSKHEYFVSFEVLMALSIPISVFWGVTPHTVVERMEPASSPKAPVPLYQTTWWHISEDWSEWILWSIQWLIKNCVTPCCWLPCVELCSSASSVNVEEIVRSSVNKLTCNCLKWIQITSRNENNTYFCSILWLTECWIYSWLSYIDYSQLLIELINYIELKLNLKT